MVTTSYPRFPGDSVGTFMEPIAKSVAARGTRCTSSRPGIRCVARGARGGWRRVPLLQATRRSDAERVRLCRRRCAPTSRCAGRVDRRAAGARAGMADGARGRAAASTPRSCTATGWSPAAITAALAAPALPLVVSLHGSDVFVAETHHPRAAAARAAFRRGRGHRLQRRSRATRDRRSAPTRRASRSSPTASTPTAFARPRRAAARAKRLGVDADAVGLRRRPAREEEGVRVPDRRHAARSAATCSRLAVKATSRTRAARARRPHAARRDPSGFSAT